MKINFTKMHGLGNDFMVIDNTKGQINTEGQIGLNAKQIAQLSNRNLGVGFDQLLLVEQAENSENDFKYRIFNADGSEVEQCGNGARCFARFVVEKNLTSKKGGEYIWVETKKDVIVLEILDDDSVLVTMGKAIWNPDSIPFKQIKNDNATYVVEGETVGVVSVGNPHAVLIVDDINQDIEVIAKKIQSSANFPEGVNVNFVKIIDERHISLRVYERGVGETQACGSGACATVAYLGKAAKVDVIDKEIVVQLKGGELKVFNSVKNQKLEIVMIGPAEFVFEGQIEI